MSTFDRVRWRQWQRAYDDAYHMLACADCGAAPLEPCRLYRLSRRRIHPDGNTVRGTHAHAARRSIAHAIATRLVPQA